MDKLISKIKLKLTNKTTRKLIQIWIFSLPLLIFLIFLTFSFISYLSANSELPSFKNIFENVDYKIILYTWLIYLMLTLLYIYLLFFYKGKHVAPNSTPTKSIQYGSAQWLSKEQIDELFPLSSYNTNIVNKNYGFVIQTRNINNDTYSNVVKDCHALVVGSTGSGKTQKVIIPTIQLNARSIVKPTMIITDPKGELFNTQSQLLHEQGYKVWVINLRDNKYTSFWNPLNEAYNYWKKSLTYKDTNADEYRKLQAKTLEKLDDITQTLSPVTDAKNSFFESNGANLIRAIAIAMLEDLELSEELLPIEKFNLSSIATIINDTNLPTYFEKRKATSASRQAAASYLGGIDTDTSVNFKQQAISALSAFSDPWIQTITCQNDIDFKDLIINPTAIFIIVPDEKINRHNLANLFITQIYKSLVDEAHKSIYQTLQRPVYFLCDEFANMPALKNISNWLTTSRSRNIWFFLIIQDLAQLESKYQKQKDTIINNCNLHIFLGGNDIKTVNFYSELLGTQTLAKKTVSSNRTKVTGYSTSLEKTKLIEAAEMLKLNPNEAIIKTNGKDPARTQLPPFYDNKNYVKGRYGSDKETKLINFDNYYYNIDKRINFKSKSNIDYLSYIYQTLLKYLSNQQKREFELLSEKELQISFLKAIHQNLLKDKTEKIKELLLNNPGSIERMKIQNEIFELKNLKFNHQIKKK